MNAINNIALGLLAISLAGCASVAPKSSAKEGNAAYQIPMSQAEPVAMQEVTPTIAPAPVIVERKSSRRFDVSVAESPAKEVFHMLSSLSGSSIVLHHSIKEPLTVNLRDVDIYQALRLLQRLYGYDIHQDGNVFIVNPPDLITEVIPFNYLTLERTGQSQISVNSGGVQQSANNRGGSRGNNGSNNQSGNNNNSANDQQNGQSGRNSSGGNNTPSTQLTTSTRSHLFDTLAKQLGNLLPAEGGRSFSIEPNSGMIMVTAYPTEMVKVRDYLSKIETQLKRQVVLDVKIIEMDLSDEHQQGVNWDRIAAEIGSTGLSFSTSGTAVTQGNAITSQLGGAATLTFNNADFSGILRLLSTQGNAKVLSSPRITALSNQKAVIKVGTDEFFVTDISSTTIVGSGVSSQTPDITLEAFFSGISLDITPQISARGEILLHIAPSVVETREQMKIVKLNGEQIELPLAQSNIRQADTLISANDGEVVVIGGLMRNEKTKMISKVPVLGSIPGLGALFRSSRDVNRNQELIILVRPVIIDNNNPLYNDGEYRKSLDTLWSNF